MKKLSVALNLLLVADSSRQLPVVGSAVATRQETRGGDGRF
jgi:hypothetical protein